MGGTLYLKLKRAVFEREQKTRRPFRSKRACRDKAVRKYYTLPAELHSSPHSPVQMPMIASRLIMIWFARPSLPVGRRTLSPKTTASCISTASRIWTVISGNSSTWNPARQTGIKTQIWHAACKVIKQSLTPRHTLRHDDRGM